MFSTLGRLVGKYAILVVLFWIAFAALYFFIAPTISEVGVTDQSQFLPKGTESTYARDLLNEKFTATAESSNGTTVILVGLSPQDISAAEDIRNWLLSDKAPDVISQVVSIFDAPNGTQEREYLNEELLSSDNTTMMMIVYVSVSPLSDTAQQAAKQIREYIQSEHPDTVIYLTGDVGLYTDLFNSIQQTIDRTTLVTIILVAILLLLVYRSPIAALVPLITIGCSYLVARGLLGYLGQAGMSISTLADAYLVVTIFGVGTDYCLFIVSRFREELAYRERVEARDYTLRQIWPVILASATTVIVSFLCLGISRFEMNKTTGIALAIGVGITLIAGLTLIPALMSLFGRHLFWPAKTPAKRREGGFGWSKIGQWITKRPIVVALPIIVLLLLPYTALFDLNQSADIASQLPKNAESAQGLKLLTEKFEAGKLMPLYLLIESPGGNVTGPDSLNAITIIAQSLQKVDGVSQVDYSSGPHSQLSEFSTQTRSIADALYTGGSLDLNSFASLQALLQALSDCLKQLPPQYPGVVQSQNFQQTTTDLTQISVVAGEIGTAAPADLPGLLTELQGLSYHLADSLASLGDEFMLVGESPFVDWLLANYFSADGTTAKVNIVLQGNPYSSKALETVTQLRETVSDRLPETSLNGASHYIGGETAIDADIMHTNSTDFGRVVGLSIAAILIVIAVLLRSLLAPLYMVATVLLNYGATLGICTWVFLDVLKQGSMIYMIPVLVFVILVAVGADYNIFLLSRIREEAEKRPIREAVQHAVANTGGVITACGIILAGTFATLMSSPLQVVFQIGAAIAIGVLIDTFIVRALLVPCLTAIAGRWSWWPSRLFWRLNK
jgi:RND superfamily putative drug exporter